MLKHVVLYTDGAHPHNARARQILADARVPFTELKLHEDFTHDDVKELYPEASTYPIVVIDDFHVGSYPELQKRLNEELSDKRKLLLEDVPNDDSQI